jgi:hypothetical protein
MTVRVSAVLIALCCLAEPAHGQALRRERPQAFPPAVTVFVGLGFGGSRANEFDSQCPSPTNCINNKPGSGPQGGLEIQFPVTSTLGISLAATGGRPTLVNCLRGQCQTSGRITQLHGAGLVLWRFKARAPIYFGLGPGVAYSSPGAVRTQTQAISEIGGVAVIAGDLRLAQRVGVRIAWWNWVVKPKSEGLGPDFTAKSLAWDRLFSVGARFSFGS